MRLDLKKTTGLLALTALVAGVGVAEARRGREEKLKDSLEVVGDSRGSKGRDTQPVPVPEEVESPQAQAVITYDEVGYASAYADEISGGATANGEALNPAGHTAAHATLPMPSYAEVTNLDTGKTILVRINDRGPAGGGRLIALSSGAANDLGMSSNGRTPVRVRRVNPPEQEKAALRMGQKAADRLDTPPQLLTALRKKLGASPVAPGVPAPVRQAALPPSAVNVPAAAVAGATYQPAQIGDDGFIIEEAGARRPVRAAMPKAAVVAPRVAVAAPKPRPAPAGRPGATYEAPVIGKDGFIVEQAGQRRSAPNMAPQSVAARGEYFVQVAAFSNEARARATAGQTGSGIERAGSIWRVRKGPFANEASARVALGPVVAKGYRDARITR
jgi:rare lipoprotein A